MKRKLFFLVLTLFSSGVIFFVGSSFSVASADAAPTGCEGGDCPDVFNYGTNAWMKMHCDGLDYPPYYQCCGESGSTGKMMVNPQNPE